MSLLSDDRISSSPAPGIETQPQTVDGPGVLSAPAAATSGEGVSERYPGRTVTHVRQGLWDVYEEINPDGGRIAFAAGLKKKYSDVVECAPYIVRMFKDVLSIPGCKSQIGMYAITEIVASLVPALSLWYQGQLISMMETAMTKGTVNARRLLRICAGRIVCTIASMILKEFRTRAQDTLDARIRRWFALHSFRAYARVDVPTFARKEVQKRLLATSNDLYGSTVIWQTLRTVTEAASKITQVGAQTFVLLNALKGLKGGTMLALLTLAAETVPLLSSMELFSTDIAWAVTTRSMAYLKLQGWKSAIMEQKHRKEFVAGNMAEYAISEYAKAEEAVGDQDRSWVDMLNNSHIDMYTVMQQLATHIPQVAFTIHALSEPSDMPEFLASLNLVQSAGRGFAWSVYEMVSRTRSITGQFLVVRDVYEAGNIPNIIQDGTLSFPEDDTRMKSGVALEFRNVSFKYPESDKYALRNVSFSLEPGQLCVIVGSNGAGKSTILKLIVRLYGPEEGEILLGGHDIRTLKLHDLREAISVLFQDYTHFPLSIRDNIALGDPSGSGDETHVRLAARLGGAESFVEKLSDGFDTYLERPDTDYFSGLPEGSKTVLGNPFDCCAVKDAAGIKSTTTSGLSGGQMQRLAVARTFMRSVVREDAKVGLLLFDEPSASLDPAAEHDLFDRLRELRGSKTMVFSSHRFGNLTRHSDLILYMDDSGIVESGTHVGLLNQEGEYARLWRLQAQAFI